MHHPTRYRLPMRLSLLTLCLGLAAPGWTQSVAAQPAAQVAISLPAQPLDKALTELAARTGLLIGADSSLLAGKQAPAISGTYTPLGALQRLLTGSGLEAVPGSDGSVQLRRMSASGEEVLPTVSVKGQQETATGPVIGYVAKRSATATKTDTPIIETPQSISIITADQMTTLKAQTLEDALAYTAGITSVSGYSSSFDRFTSRGFTIDDDSGSVYRDGLKVSGTSWASGQQEPYGLERVEFLKGASSVLYGASSPGGILNTVSKRPTGDRIREVNVEVGNLRHRQLAADLGDKITEDGSLSWRLVALARDADTQTDYIPNNSRYIAPSLKWQPSADTSLTLLAHYQERKSAYRYPLPAIGTLVPSAFGTIPSNRFVGEPGFDRQVNTQYGIGYVFEHAFSEQTSIRHSLRYINGEGDVRFTTSLATFNPNTPFYSGRVGVQEYERTSGVSTDTSITHKVKTGNIQHTLIGGVDYSHYKPESEWYADFGGFPALNLYNPVYGATVGTLSQYANASKKQINTRTGVYLQDQMKIADKLVLLLGGRHDWTENKLSPFFGPENYQTEKADKFTGRAGAVYLAENGLAPYVSFSQSFEPQAGTNYAGNRFKPTTGEQYELGIRYQPKDADYLLSASVFELTRQNVLTRDPANAGFNVQTGEVRSRGVELEAKGKVGRHANVIASYAYIDATITQSNVSSEIGQRQPNVPHNQLSLWGDYQMASFGLPALKIGLGARYIGSTKDVGSGGTNGKVPAYTLFDAMASYDLGNWRLSLNARNLGDKTYLNCSYGQCLYGEPRKIVAAASYRW